METLQTPARPALSLVRRPVRLLGASLLAVACFALPASAQDHFPRVCGFEPTESVDYCARFGMAFDQEECKCKSYEIDWPSVNGIYDLCDFTPDAAKQICRSRGMYFNPVECSCMTLRIVPREVFPEIPRPWWDSLPKGIIKSEIDGRLELHRGEGLFIRSTVEELDAAVELMLQGASVPEIEAQGFEVTEAEGY